MSTFNGSAALMLEAVGVEGESDAASYASDADDLKMRTLADYTLILNKRKKVRRVTGGIDPTRMPVQMKRITPSIPSSDGFSETIRDTGPWAYWRFDEDLDAMPPFGSSNILRNWKGPQARSATYARDKTSTATVATGLAGMTTEPDNTATRFVNPSDTIGAYAVINDVASLHTQMANGFACEGIIRRPGSANGGTLFMAGISASDLTNSVICWTVFSSDKLFLRLVDSADRERLYEVTSAGVSDGSWHHFVFAYDPGGDAAVCVVDGVSKSVTTSTTSGTAPIVFNEFTRARVGSAQSLGPRPYYGDLDGLAVYGKPLTIGQAQTHHTKAIAAETHTPAVFDITTIDWAMRSSGNNTTNPAPSLWQKRARISDIAFHRNRLVLAGDENIVFSQAGDFFNFFIDDVANLVDSDPIDVSLSSERITKIDNILPFRRSLLIFTKAGRQFELSAPEILTAATVAITPTTAYQNTKRPVQPVASGNLIYFVGDRADNFDAGLPKRGTTTALMEYAYDESKSSATASDLTAHVADLLPATLKTLIASSNDQVVIALRADDDSLYVHKSFWLESRREQSAWSVWTFDSESRIADIGIIDSAVYLLIQQPNGFTLERMTLSPSLLQRAWPYPLHMDCVMQATGVYDAIEETTTWTLNVADDGFDAVVLGPDFDDDAGLIITDLDVDEDGSQTTIVADGDYSAGVAAIGKRFVGEIVATRPFARDFNGLAHVDGRMQVRKIAVTHQNAGAYSIVASMPQRTDRTKAFTPPSGSHTQTFGTLVAWFNGNAADIEVKLRTHAPTPCTLSSVEYISEYESRMN